MFNTSNGYSLSDIAAVTGGNRGNGGFQAAAPAPAPAFDAGDGFMNIPDGIDEELPFN